MSKTIIETPAAPAAIGTYSQAVRVGNTVYLSGQIGMNAEDNDVMDASFENQAHQVFKNLRAVAEAAGGTLNDIVKLNFYLTDFIYFQELNLIMAEHFSEPYPARAAVQVVALPKDALFEAEGVMVFA